VLAGRLDPAPVLDSVHSLDDAAQAYAAMHERRTVKPMIVV
jgi:threonine dehydrogenase-like Zn-dependent dehydrogenase